MKMLERRARGRRPSDRRATGTLRFATFLAPKLFPVYQAIAEAIGERLGCPTQMTVGLSYDQLAHVDVAFVCGLAYVESTRWDRPPVEPLAAPIVQGRRYQGKPIYFSEVVVRRGRPFRSFADLRGRSLAYNEPHSQSGYGIIRHQLLKLKETRGFFRRVIEAGWHEQAIRMVLSNEVDAAAIDSHLWAVIIADNPELARRLHIIDTLGPSTLQPVVVRRSLPEKTKRALLDAFLELPEHPILKPVLATALIRRFVRVKDDSYRDIRRMLEACEAADFVTVS